MIELVNTDVIKNYDDIVDFYKSTNYKVVNQGFDKNRQSHYITIEDSKKRKAKVYGVFYAPEFWRQSQKKRESDLHKNSSDCSHNKSDTEKELLKEVKQLNNERKIYLDRRYAYAREKAYKKLQREALSIEWDEEELREWRSYQNLLDKDERFIKQQEEKVEEIDVTDSTEDASNYKGVINVMFKEDVVKTDMLKFTSMLDNFER